MQPKFLRNKETGVVYIWAPGIADLATMVPVESEATPVESSAEEKVEEPAEEPVSAEVSEPVESEATPDAPQA